MGERQRGRGETVSSHVAGQADINGWGVEKAWGSAYSVYSAVRYQCICGQDGGTGGMSAAVVAEVR